VESIVFEIFDSLSGTYGLDTSADSVCYSRCYDVEVDADSLDDFVEVNAA